jgi:glucose-6-phosphate isomerase
MDKVAKLVASLRAKATGSFTAFEDFISLPTSSFVPQDNLSVGGAKQVLVVGIGGSSLGAKAVCDVLKSAKLSPLYWIENVDRAHVDEVVALCKDPVVVVICKSGTTFETVRNLAYLTSATFKGLVRGDNTWVVAVEGNRIWDWGKSLGAKLFPMPAVVSGRFQVFGAVAIVPLGLVGVDTTNYLAGARASLADLMTPAKAAAVRYQLYQDGLVTDVYFAFDERLRSLAEWYASITAESLGKALGGITPVVSMGSRDLHAFSQLYLQGRRDKVTTFVSLSDTDPTNLVILTAVKKAYADAGLPYSHIELDATSTGQLTYDLGLFMQAKMTETVLLGGLMGVNPYDQPGVELYKKYLAADRL